MDKPAFFVGTGALVTTAVVRIELPTKFSLPILPNGRGRPVVLAFAFRRIRSSTEALWSLSAAAAITILGLWLLFSSVATTVVLLFLGNITATARAAAGVTALLALTLRFAFLLLLVLVLGLSLSLLALEPRPGARIR